MEACLEQFVEWSIKSNEEIEIPSTMIFSDTTQIKTSKHKIIIYHNKLGKDKLSKKEIKAITSALLGEDYYAEVTLGVSVIKPSDIKWNNIVNKVRNE